MIKSIAKTASVGAILMTALVVVCGSTGLLGNIVLSYYLAEENVTADLRYTQGHADMMHDAIHADVLGAIAALDPSSGVIADQVAKDFKEDIESLRADIAAIAEGSKGQPYEALIASVDKPLQGYIASAEKVFTAAQSNPAAAGAALGTFTQQFLILEQLMDRVGDKIAEMADEQVSWARMLGIALSVLTGLALAGGIGSSLLMYRIARRDVVDPLVDITAVTRRIIAGERDVTIPSQDRGDEIGELAGAMNLFKENVIAHERSREAAFATERAASVQAAEKTQADQDLVVAALADSLRKLANGDLTNRLWAEFPASYESLRQDFNHAVDQLQETLKAIALSAGGILGEAASITHASDDLAQRTERQAASHEETAAALGEVTSTVRKAADGARQASAVVAATRTDAEMSGEVMQRTVAAMDEIEKSSNQISQIIGVMDEIAFQTNLLALNAGVEAARAGEAGKGFAVVASEVRTLAQRSSEAAKEIKDLISASSRHVEAGVALVGEAGNNLQLIVGKVAEISKLVADIAASAQDQSTTLVDVNHGVNQMDQVTQQNAAMVEETTAACHSLSAEAGKLMTLIARFETGIPTNLLNARHPGVAAMSIAAE